MAFFDHCPLFKIGSNLTSRDLDAKLKEGNFVPREKPKIKHHFFSLCGHILNNKAKKFPFVATFYRSKTKKFLFFAQFKRSPSTDIFYFWSCNFCFFFLEAEKKGFSGVIFKDFVPVGKVTLKKHFFFEFFWVCPMNRCIFFSARPKKKNLFEGLLKFSRFFLARKMQQEKL